MKKNVVVFFFVGLLTGFSQGNLPPELSVSGKKPYCPETQIFIAENFNITDLDDNSIETFVVQISSGYQIGNDILILNGNHPTIITDWNIAEGKLTLTSFGSSEILYSDLIPAVRDIQYQSLTSNVTGEKFFSFNIGDANYLPSTGHYYEYIVDNLVDWETARQKAGSLNYFGLQGYLATISSANEAQIAGEQAAGTGWIGGSDAEQEGVWKWVTGPEAGIVFWNGGVNGSSPNFSFWNNNEPNNLGNEDYAHVTDPSVGIPGAWNDLPLNGGTGLYTPRGYVVEYGGMPSDPVLNISGSTSIYIPKITSVFSGEACQNEQITLKATADGGEVYWYDAPTGGNLLGTGTSYTTEALSVTTVYYAVISISGCTHNFGRVQVVATIHPTPVLNNDVSLERCGRNQTGFSVFNLTDANALLSSNFADETFVYYKTEVEAQSTTNPINNPKNYQNIVEINDSVWGRITTAKGCHKIAKVDLKVIVNSDPVFFQIENELYCDSVANGDGTDGIVQNIDLNKLIPDILGSTQSINDFNVTFHETLADVTSGDNPLPTPYTNITRDRQTIYVRIQNNKTSCVNNDLTFDVIINPLPSFSVVTPQTICLNDPKLIISADNPSSTYDYQWTLPNGNTVLGVQELEISSGGIYKIKATNITGCSRVKEINVEEFVGTEITQNDVTIVDDSQNNSISIDATNLEVENYEYALVDERGIQSFFQDEPLFENLSGGGYTIVIRDKNGCLPNTTLEVSIIEFPKFFTPNNDGENDTWVIKGVNSTLYPNAQIKIFNRFGKMVATVNINLGWDGSYNGKKLPSDDYWFSASLIPNDSSKPIINRKGNISLLRR